MTDDDPVEALRALWDGTNRIPDCQLLDWTQRIRAGETGTEIAGIARQILIDFVLRAWFNQPQSPLTLSWLAGVIDEILDKGKPDARRSFSLSPKPEGRPAGSRDAALSVRWVHCACELGYTLADAKQRGANVWNCDPKTLALRLRDTNTSCRNPDLAYWQPLFQRIGKSLPDKAKPKPRKRKTER